MLMTLKSLLHFLNMNYLLLFLKFLLVSVNQFIGVILFFKLNSSKFDLIYFSKSSRLIESFPTIIISSSLSLAPSSTIHSLGFTFDSSLSLIQQIKSVAKSSFFYLCRVKQVKLFLDNPTLKLLVSSLILSLLTIVTLYTMESQRTRYILSPKLLIALSA